MAYYDDYLTRRVSLSSMETFLSWQRLKTGSSGERRVTFIKDECSFEAPGVAWKMHGSSSALIKSLGEKHRV